LADETPEATGLATASTHGRRLGAGEGDIEAFSEGVEWATAVELPLQATTHPSARTSAL
jgi:hypothetical protein